MDGADERVAVVVLTHDRRAQTLETLDRLAALPERPPLIVVDNASGDGTAEAVAGRHPEATLVRLPANLGAAGRNCGAALAPTPYVAFNDDDSWWAPGALGRAADLLDAHPATALVAARVLVREEARLDPSCRAMEASPLRAAGAPGPAVLGFVACGAVVRRGAFLAVGGFRLGYGVGGEEELLALDLAAAGWALAYCADVVAHHHPSSLRPPAAERRRRQARNALRRTAAVAATAVADPAVRGALADAVGDLGWVARERRPVARPLERDVALLDGAGAAP